MCVLICVCMYVACFDCRDWNCRCYVPAHMCRNLPAHFLVDYIRVYQSQAPGASSGNTLTCNPMNYPTANYINNNAALYTEPLDVEGYELPGEASLQVLQPTPLQDIKHGGAKCTLDEECNSDSPYYSTVEYLSRSATSSGIPLRQNYCEDSRCVCDIYHAGSSCAGYFGYDDVVYIQDTHIPYTYVAPEVSYWFVLTAATAVAILIGFVLFIYYHPHYSTATTKLD